MKKQIYLILGAIASGKSSLLKKINLPNDKEIEYLCADNYKKLYFEDGINKHLKKAYRCADELLFYRMEALCSNRENMILEFCPTNRNKFETIKYYARKYNYSIVSYYVGTDNVSINLFRNEERESVGGDHVPSEKIKSRYEDAFNSVLEIACISKIMYFIDNSTNKYRLIAKLQNNKFWCYANDCDWFNTRVKLKLINQGE